MLRKAIYNLQIRLVQFKDEEQTEKTYIIVVYDMEGIETFCLLRHILV